MPFAVEVDFFPDKFEINARLWRTDLDKLYVNIGTFAVPTYSEIGGGNVPTGSITMFAGLTAQLPADWVRCDGTSYDTSAQSALFAAIGYEWGGSGANFNVPDFETNNVFPRAADNDSEVAQTGGQSTHTLITGELPSHTHSITPNPHSHTYSHRGAVVSNGGGGPASNDGLQNATTATADLTIGSVGSDSAHENKPPYASIYYIIKL